MRVHVDETGRDDLTGGIDLASASRFDLTNYRDAIITDRKIPGDRGSPGAVDQASSTNDEIELLRLNDGGAGGDQQGGETRGRAKHGGAFAF
ncbi:MAG: hypothetical protein ACREH8_24160 [Opitutaceae bacterium]